MTIFYERYAGLSKQDTLFLHGNLASHRWWHPTVQELKKMGARGEGSVVLSDWRGCGENETWPSEKQIRLEELAQDQIELLDSLGMKDNTALVGHSLGGLIALQMMILKPNRFSRAVLLDPVGAKGVVFDPSMYEAFRQMSLSADLTRAVILSTVTDPEKLSAGFKDAVARDAFKAVRGIGASVLEMLKGLDIRGAAAGVKVPTLILHGAKDQIIPKADSEELNQLMPNSELEILPANGHCWNVENPRAFTERTSQFLNA